jgi:ABC-type spermidine/putrescine transport system permease subunit II
MIMGLIFLIGISVASTAFVWFQTIQGYRTGVLNVRSRIDQRVSPRLYAINMFLMVIACIMMLVGTAVLIYGETRPAWHAKEGVRLFK